MISRNCREAPGACTYSRSMNQKYPRSCVHCGEPELSQEPGAVNYVKPGEVLVDLASKKDKTVHSVIAANPEKPVRLIAVLPGEEAPCMTTWRDRVIIAQGTRIYELKQDVHDEYALIELSQPPQAGEAA